MDARYQVMLEKADGSFEMVCQADTIDDCIAFIRKAPPSVFMYRIFTEIIIARLAY